MYRVRMLRVAYQLIAETSKAGYSKVIIIYLQRFSVRPRMSSANMGAENLLQSSGHIFTRPPQDCQCIPTMSSGTPLCLCQVLPYTHNIKNQCNLIVELYTLCLEKTEQHIPNTLLLLEHLEGLSHLKWSQAKHWAMIDVHC